MVDDLLDRRLDTNVRGPLRVMRAVLPTWRKRGSPVVINVSSVAVPYGDAYAASKHAPEAMTEALHYEMVPFGLRFALIEPGELRDGVPRQRGLTLGREASPYDERAVRFRTALGCLDGGEHSDPQLAADAIILAATDASPHCARWSTMRAADRSGARGGRLRAVREDDAHGLGYSGPATASAARPARPRAHRGGRGSPRSPPARRLPRPPCRLFRDCRGRSHRRHRVECGGRGTPVRLHVASPNPASSSDERG